MNTEKQVLAILEKTGAIITNSHFVYTSGKHGSVYVRKDKIYPYTAYTSKICSYFAQDTKNLEIEVVVGPSLGGIILSQWTAYHLSRFSGKEIYSVFTEKPSDEKGIFDKAQVFKRGYDAIVRGRKVLVVEDLTTTGQSVKKVVETVKAAGGNVVCVYVMVNRNPENVNSRFMDAPFRQLAVFKAEAFDEADCPLCRKNVPINTEVGHGKEYLAGKKPV